MNPHFKEREVVVSDEKMADEKRKNHAKTLIYQHFNVIQTFNYDIMEVGEEV